MKKRKRHTGWIVVLCMAAAIAVIAGIYSRFGGFGTGNCADTEEFAKYAASVSELTVPDEVQIVALGEATHGNKEFQQLRLDVLQVLVEKYGVRAFALEGDFGGCEAINRYIHGEGGTAAEALSATGFAIYRTEEMENLVEWMRNYNASATQGDDLRFYGFDMEQRAYTYRYLLEALQKANIDTADFEKMWNSEANTYADGYTVEQRTEIITAVKEQLPPDDVQAIHFADILLQNIELGKYIDDSGELNAQRDRMMAENTLWILQQEQARGNSRILISGHNNHTGAWEKSGEILGKAAESLEAAGADFILICTNTMHKVFEQVQRYVNIPFIHIAQATADVLKRENITRVGLLGTKYTMEQDFYKGKLAENGISVVIPDADDIETVNSIIFHELCVGKIEDKSRKKYLEIIDKMSVKGVQGVILGCTEIGLLIHQEDTYVKLFDTTQIHGEAAAYMSLDRL